MLVLSRHQNGRLIITGPCVLTVVAVRGDKVRLGISAPESAVIIREEVLASGKVPAGCSAGNEAARQLFVELVGREPAGDSTAA